MEVSTLISPASTDIDVTHFQSTCPWLPLFQFWQWQQWLPSRLVLLYYSVFQSIFMPEESRLISIIIYLSIKHLTCFNR